MSCSTLWLIAISLLFSAFFSGVEIAFVSSNRVRVELDKKKRSISGYWLNLFYRHQEQFISTLLVGNNVALVLYGIGMATLLGDPLRLVWNNEAFVLLAQTFVSTAIVLVTAEFLPKTIFRITPNALLRFFVLPLALIYLLLYPVARLSTLLSKGLLRMAGVRISTTRPNRLLSKVDLDFFIRQCIDDSPSDAEVETEVKIFQNALDFSNVRVRDCMVPRTEVVAVDRETTDREELISLFTRTGRSKLIVYNEHIDNIVGYIHSSEMFKEDDWRQGINPISFVPETMSAPKLMKQLMLQKRSIAAVVDEFGGTAGIVTLEDLVEEIFGDIEDEHDVDRRIARCVGENEYLLSGRLEIEEANEQFGFGIPESDEYVTVAGYILFHHQTLPKQGDTFSIDRFQFKIVKVSATRIELVRMKIRE